MVGTNLNHYQITAKLGQGGMGEVYRATDTKLNRDVAIKVLPESFANNKERLIRFQREAEVLASLNHPSIAGIHGLEQSDGVNALVLELVKGEDLSQRIKRGALPVDEALDVCKQIAEALEAAHEKGIIHRDLKPANVKLTEDGKIKVLDFGLAKATSPDSSNTSTTDSLSPTITADYTMPGTLLGTAAYMSPEQARGKAVDKRSDIWSFGCVLYECLTGKRMFKGEDTTQTLAKILESEPDWAALPTDTPPTIHLLLRKCLVKDRKHRTQDIGDARVDLEQAIADPSSSFVRLSDGALAETRAGGGIPRQLVTGLVLGVAVVAVALTWILKPTPVVPVPPAPPPLPIRQLNVDIGLEGRLDIDARTTPQLSPDGSNLAFLAFPNDGNGLAQLFLKRLDQLGEPIPLEGTENASQFCFSPDGQWIAFRIRGQSTLNKVSISGGTALSLGESGITSGIHWPEEDSIFFGTFESTNGIMRIPAGGGGKPVSVTTVADDSDRNHRYPQLFPGGRALLFTAVESSSADSDVMLQRLDATGAPDGEPQLLLQGGHQGVFLSTGHLLFMRGVDLYAKAFDVDSLTTIGNEVLVIPEVVRIDSRAGQFHFCDADGSLVYISGTATTRLYELKWVDRLGEYSLFGLEPGHYGEFLLSPIGEQLAYESYDGSQWDIWIKDVERRGRGQPLTTDPNLDRRPAWSPDGGSIVFCSNRDGQRCLYWKRSDFQGDAHRLTEEGNSQVRCSWHPSSRHIAVNELVPDNSFDIRILEMKGNDRSGWTTGVATNFLATVDLEACPSFSPDGAWLAYHSNRTGQREVYVRPSGGGAPILISEGEFRSVQPLWSQTTNELVFAIQENPNSREWQVKIASYEVVDGEFKPKGNPVKWPGATIDTAPWPNYDLHPDGKKLLVTKLAETEAEDNEQRTFDQVVLFLNFDEHLRKTVPTGKK